MRKHLVLESQPDLVSNPGSVVNFLCVPGQMTPPLEPVSLSVNVIIGLWGLHKYICQGFNSQSGIRKHSVNVNWLLV